MARVGLWELCILKPGQPRRGGHSNGQPGVGQQPRSQRGRRVWPGAPGLGGDMRNSIARVLQGPSPVA